MTYDTEKTKKALCAWVLTTRTTWSEPKQDFHTKAKLHIPQKLKNSIAPDTLEQLLDTCAKQADKLQEPYLNAVADTTLIWGVANYHRAKGTPAREAFDIAIKTTPITYKNIAATTKRLYSTNMHQNESIELHQQFLTAIANAIIEQDQ